MMKLITKCLILFVLSLSLSSISSAADAVVPPQNKAFGKTYAQWAVDWVKWVVSIRKEINPMFDKTGAYAAIRQSGKVWFLAGTTNADPKKPATATRRIAIPNDTALFLPILNSYWVNTPEYGDAPWSAKQEVEARKALASRQDIAKGLWLSIDGKAVNNIKSYRVASKVGRCRVPVSDKVNIFGAILKNNPYYCLADGYWALINPLATGRHTVRFKGTIPGATAKDNPFVLDVIYVINVEPKGKSQSMKLHG